MTGSKDRDLPRVITLILLAAFTFISPAHARDWTKEDKAQALNLAGIAGITAWGVANWDYFENTPKKADERWFSEHTPEGGADKCAHFYFSYTLSQILAATYDHWGYDHGKAGALGALSAFGLMGYMEFGDSFSSYGFSREDFIMNLLGSAAGFLLYRNKTIADKIDFRMEYIPRFSDADLVSDYDHMKFLAALKLSGFAWAKDSPWRYLEFHAGYYARGYPHDPGRERNIYIGLGINLSEVFSALSMEKLSKVFTYYQLPYTYLSREENLNHRD